MSTEAHHRWVFQGCVNLGSSQLALQVKRTPSPVSPYHFYNAQKSFVSQTRTPAENWELQVDKCESITATLKDRTSGHILKCLKVKHLDMSD